MSSAKFVLPFAALLIPTAVSAQSFVGDWIVTAEAPGASVFEEVKVTKTDDGYAVAAKLVGDVPEGMQDGGPGYDIVLDGDNFIYKRDADTQGGTITLTYSGVVKGDKFEGTADIGGFKIPYNGQRIAPGS